MRCEAKFCSVLVEHNLNLLLLATIFPTTCLAVALRGEMWPERSLLKLVLRPGHKILRKLYILFWFQHNRKKESYETNCIM